MNCLPLGLMLATGSNCGFLASLLVTYGCPSLWFSDITCLSDVFSLEQPICSNRNYVDFLWGLLLPPRLSGFEMMTV